MSGRGGRAAQSLRAHREEQEMARYSRNVKERYGTRVLDDENLEYKESPMTAEEKHMMERIFARKEAAERDEQHNDDDDGDEKEEGPKNQEKGGSSWLSPNQRAGQGQGQPPTPAKPEKVTSGARQHKEGGDGGSDDEEYFESLRRLPPLMQQYVMECNKNLKSLEKACLENPDASVEFLIEDRQRKADATNHNPSETEVTHTPIYFFHLI